MRSSPSSVGRISSIIVTLLLGVGVLMAPAAAAKSPADTPSGGAFRIGYGDSLLTSPTPGTPDLWAGRAVAGGATVERINIRWSNIAPDSPPPGFDPADPNSSGYDWEDIDGGVRAAVAHGLTVMFTVYSAPSWAEEPGRPADINPGTWRPRPGAFGAFAQALAKRYSGSYPDPLAPGAALPRVRFFEAWNEPNLDNYLAPQTLANGRLVGPTIYRRLLNRFYAGVKASQPDAKVLGASFAPFGDETGRLTAPVLFLRSLLCLRGGRLKPIKCPEKAHLDILSTHPIQVGPPTESAESPLDVTTPDLGRVTTVVHAAEQAGTVLPTGHKGLWVTEFWVDTNPPDPLGIPLAKQARWYEQDLYEYWLAGAEVAIELQLRDEPPGKAGYASTLQSGIYFLDGRPKPSQMAMRFPFVAHRSGPDQVSVWGIAPKPGLVRIQALRGGSWHTLASVRGGGRGRPFTAKFPLSSETRLRAQLGDEQSLIWKLG